MVFKLSSFGIFRGNLENRALCLPLPVKPMKKSIKKIENTEFILILYLPVYFQPPEGEQKSFFSMCQDGTLISTSVIHRAHFCRVAAKWDGGEEPGIPGHKTAACWLQFRPCTVPEAPASPSGFLRRGALPHSQALEAVPPSPA